MMHLFVLLGIPIGASLDWASELAPRVAAGRADASCRGESEDPARDCRFRERLSLGAVIRPNGRTFGVVVLTSGLLALLNVRFGISWQLVPAAVACLFFLLVAIVDLKHRLVLNAMVVPAGGLVLLARAIASWDDLWLALIGSVIGCFPFLLTALVKPAGMGGGDVKLAALVGMTVGFPEVVWAMVLAILSGGIVSLLLLLSRKWTTGDVLPYAPFLCSGAIVALLYDPLTPALLAIAR